MQALPLLHQRIISIDQKGVVKLIPKLLLQGPETGEIHHKPTWVEVGRGEPHSEAAAVTVHKPAMSRVLPLPMATGVPLEMLAAGVTSGGQRHREEKREALRQDSSCLHLQQAQPNAAPHISLH